MTRLRVARVIARMNVGGPALQVAALTDGLDPSRFESLLLTGSVGPAEGDYLSLRAPHLRPRCIGGLGRSPDPWSDARALRSLVAELRRFRPHVVHTHTAKAGVLGRLAARLAGVPATVHTFHGHLLHGYFSPPTTWAVVRAERTLARGTTRLVTVGARVRDDLLRAGVGRPAQFTVVPPGVELGPLPSAASARRALGLAPHGTVVTFVGRLTGIKRPERFVEVASRLAGRFPEATFALVGNGELMPDLRAQARPLGPRVRFLGWRPDIGAVHAASDLVVLTSDNEGMPVSLIEAAVAGRAVVATGVGSTREVVVHEETGLVTSTSVDDVTAAVARLLADPVERARLATAAAERARREFSRERLVADTERLYDEVAAELGLHERELTLHR